MITASGSLERDQTPLNRIVKYTLTVSWSGAGNDFVVDPPEPPTLENLALLSSASRSIRGMDNDRQVQQLLIVYELRPLQVGPAKIAPPAIRYLKTATNELGTLEVAEQALSVSAAPTGLLSRG